jgi:serine/threonine-protein kinase
MNTDNMVGRTVAGYHLAKYIGEGGTATVYCADHAERGQAAVKILRPRLASDPIAVKRFLREAEYGARVSHPNIVRTYDYGDSDGLHYLALEWARGEPLAEFVNRWASWPRPWWPQSSSSWGRRSPWRTAPGSSTGI